jgi:hypothetical protein
LDSGVLLTWTKGFSAKNAIGHDVVQLLQHAFDKKHMHVKCVALVNDVCLLIVFVNFAAHVYVYVRRSVRYFRDHIQLEDVSSVRNIYPRVIGRIANNWTQGLYSAQEQTAHTSRMLPKSLSLAIPLQQRVEAR